MPHRQPNRTAPRDPLTAPNRFLSISARYLLAAALVLAMVLLRRALNPVIGAGTVYITLFPAMVILAVTLGKGPGVFGNAIGIVLAEYFLVEPAGHLTPNLSLAVRSALMLFTTFYVGRVGDDLRAARLAAEGEIAERKRSEAALQNTLQRFYHMLSNMYSGLLLMTADGRVEFLNQAFCDAYALEEKPSDLVGITSEELFQKILPEFENGAAAGVRVREIISRGEPVKVEEFAMRGGRTAIRDFIPLETDGRSSGRLWIHTDITELRRAEAARQESEERFRLVQELSPDGFTIFRPVRDASGAVVDFVWVYENQAMGRLNGTDPDAVVGRRLLEVLPSHADSLFHVIYRKVSESGEPAVLEAPFHGETMAERKWFRVVVVPAGPDIAILAQDITDRKGTEEALTTSLREKDVLLKEIHHRVKNNLQVISSLVRLQAAGVEDEAVREVFHDVTNRVRSMALVHEKLYQSQNLARIDFGEYTRSLLTSLWRSQGAVAAPVRLEFDLEPVQLPVDTAVPCGLILNELAGNALKHAFRGRSRGAVTVSLTQGRDGRIALAVADDGVGIPEGVDWRQATSLGLRLVQMLASQIGATVEMNSSAGTAFTILFSAAATTSPQGIGP